MFQIKNSKTNHCVKSVRTRSYSGPHFPAFGLNTKRYEVSLCIQSKCGKMWTRIIPNTDTFYAVNCFQNIIRQLKINIKGLNSRAFVKIIKMLSKSFVTGVLTQGLLYGNIFHITSFLRTFLVGYLFYPKLLFDELFQ